MPSRTYFHLLIRNIEKGISGEKMKSGFCALQTAQVLLHELGRQACLA